MFLEKETIIFWGTPRPLRSIHDILGSIHAVPADSISDSDAGTQDTSADDEGKATVQKVQALIDALPEVDAFSTMQEDELNAAYLAVQEAYDAYDALTAEQQAQIMGADCFEELFGWFNGQVALLATGDFQLNYGTIDKKTGRIVPWNVVRNGCQIVDETMTVWTVQYQNFYVLKDNNVTLSSLTINGGSNAYLYLLGTNPTLTINGPLTFENGSGLYIYGPADGTGKVIINNSSAQAAILGDNKPNSWCLAVCGVELEITSDSGLISDGASLWNGDGYARYMEYKIDGETKAYDENKELLNGKKIEGHTLTIEKATLNVENVTEFFEYTKSGTQTINVANLVPGARSYAPGTAVGDTGILSDIITIDATGLMKFALSELTKDNIDKKVTVPVTITSENYKDVRVNVIIYISPEYRIIDGANSSWTQNTDGTVVIRGNGEFSMFHAVKVDGKVIDPANYEAKEGSTIITLKAEYLKTLATGSHTFAIVWNNGIAGTNFTVAANTPDNNGNNNSSSGSNQGGSNDSSDNTNTSIASATGTNPAQEMDKVPATGDLFGIWLTLFVISLTGLAGMLARRKKN